MVRHRIAHRIAGAVARKQKLNLWAPLGVEFVKERKERKKRKKQGSRDRADNQRAKRVGSGGL